MQVMLIPMKPNVRTLCRFNLPENGNYLIIFDIWRTHDTTTLLCNR